jgi:hypothetical protein
MTAGAPLARAHGDARHRPRAPPPDRGYALHVIPRPRLAVVAALAAILLAGCAAGPVPSPSFDPHGPCDHDGVAAGAYPDLEALLPSTFDGRSPDILDSGRHCTERALGSLADDGFTEVRYAGAVWDYGGGRALAIVVFRAPDLTAPAMRRFYEEGVRAARRSNRVATSELALDGAQAFRLDVLYSGTGQTVVTWPAASADTVMVMLASELGDTRVLEILDELDGP